MSELERLKKENQQLKNALLITEHKLKNAATEIKRLKDGER